MRKLRISIWFSTVVAIGIQTETSAADPDASAGRIVFLKDYGNTGKVVVRRVDLIDKGVIEGGRFVWYSCCVEKPNAAPVIRWQKCFNDGHPLGSLLDPDVVVLSACLTHDDTIVTVEYNRATDTYKGLVCPPEVPQEPDERRHEIAQQAESYSCDLRDASFGAVTKIIDIGGNLFDESLQISLMNPKTNRPEYWRIGPLDSGRRYGWVKAGPTATHVELATKPSIKNTTGDGKRGHS